MAAGDVLDAAVLGRGWVEADPTGEVAEGLGASPVGIVLVPRDDAAVMCGLDEELVVPEADGAAEELGGGDEEGRVPEQVVEGGADAPGAEGVKEDAGRVGGLVGMVLVEEVAGMGGIHQGGQLVAEDVDLPIVEHGDAGKETVFVKRGDLLVRKTKFVPLFGGFGAREEIGDGLVVVG